MDPNEVKRLYDELKNEKAVGKVLGVTDRTVRKYLKMLNYQPQHGRKDRSKNKLAVWLKEHADVELPKSMVKIAKLVDMNPTTVRVLYHRRRTEAKGILKKLPKLIKNKDITFVDGRGMKIPGRYIVSYTILFDKWKLLFVFKLGLVNGQVVEIRLDKEGVKELCQKKKTE